MSLSLGVQATHRVFLAFCRSEAEKLTPEGRRSVRLCLKTLMTAANANAVVAYRQNKWARFAYWKVVAVYARHFQRAFVETRS